MGSPILRYKHLILLHTQIRDGCRRRLTICEWPAEFGPYVPAYQPRFGERKVLTRANQELKPSRILEPFEGKEIRATTKKKSAIPKYRSILAMQDFPPILERFNPHLSTHLTKILDEQPRWN
jgi:hypothetical protein